MEQQIVKQDLSCDVLDEVCGDNLSQADEIVEI